MPGVGAPLCDSLFFDLLPRIDERDADLGFVVLVDLVLLQRELVRLDGGILLELLVLLLKLLDVLL